MRKTIIAIILTTFIASCSDGPEENAQPAPGTSAFPAMVEVSVVDYSPAPGQFINEIPEYTTGDTKKTIASKVEKALNSGELISLGAWGGNITLKLRTPITNLAGKPDFRVLGNAYYSGITVSGEKFGSAEPGIVSVMKDTNGNGIPDDGAWYELKGDKTDAGIDNYSVTYYPPDDNATDEQYIRWESSDGDSGWINRVSAYHTQPFFPQWMPAGPLSFTGRRLPDNGIYDPSSPRYPYQLKIYDGYADSHPNDTEASALDIGNAVDPSGKPVDLDRIDFIKIYTGVLQTNGMLGECSTEISGIERLH